HDHYDHLDAPTIRALAPLDVPFYCPLGVGAHLQDWGVPAARITELDWTDEVTIGALRVVALPARHGSGRVNLPNQTLWASFALLGPVHKVYYGADSGPCDALFTEIATAHGPFDLTLLEIGAYGAQWPYIHMGPANAVRTHQLLGGGVLLPIHWGLFNLAFHAWREPVEEVLRLAGPVRIPLLLPTPGTPVDVVPEGLVTRWWETACTHVVTRALAERAPRRLHQIADLVDLGLRGLQGGALVGGIIGHILTDDFAHHFHEALDHAENSASRRVAIFIGRRVEKRT
ncbi:MAG: MBL fold metallo-hydrolase, partial [Hymenobacteraceae bacterium]|nr:MBL fold metallo-hydrolase [Hymenobacteraceae bacterium]